MFGLNSRINIIQSTRAISDSGAVAGETETVLFSNIPASIQAHVLNNLPPPSDRVTGSGQFYRRETRCWFTVASVAGVTPHTEWIIENAVTGERYRIRAVVDDAGRGHHWLLRMENYDG